jgi:proline iminopeptidase
LATVRAALGLDEVHLLGHSWGTMLLAAYLATDPAGVASAVFSSPCLDAARWTSDAEDYIAQLPDELRQALTADLAGAEIPEELFQRALDAYYARHFCRIPWPDVVEKDFAAVNMEVYESMWGPTEFKATGCLKNFDATGWLGAINVPTLFTCGRHDEASPASTASYTARVPGARMHIFEDSAHMSFLEETPEYLRVISQFLAESDSTARLGQ